jgi:hypothetical protein
MLIIGLIVGLWIGVVLGALGVGLAGAARGSDRLSPLTAQEMEVPGLFHGNQGRETSGKGNRNLREPAMKTAKTVVIPPATRKS